MTPTRSGPHAMHSACKLPRRQRPRTVPLLSSALVMLYRLPSWRFKQLIRWLLYKLEGGSVYSISLRHLMQRHFGIEVGMYTHGGWVIPFHLDAGTTVGRYCSIADTARTITHNHPLNTRSTSGLFFHPFFGLVRDNKVTNTRLSIGNDVWLGHNSIVLPSVHSIGDGAVIGAGAVVHKDVPPYAIVMGHPARVVGYRFGEARIRELLASRWWDKPLEDLVPDLDQFVAPLEDEQTPSAPANSH
jgi:virginiamycin A acetyltransferase